MTKFVIALTLIICALDIACAAGKVRRWTDVQGRKIEAKLVGYQGGMVSLEMENGRVVRFPLEKLRERDRERVMQNLPIDLATASVDIDKLIWEGLKRANVDIKEQRAALQADTQIDPTERNKELARLQHMEQMTHPTQPLSDAAFMRRVYLDIAGRVPTYAETQNFLRRGKGSAKRAALIDELLDSEAFVSHFFNYLSDLLRVRDGISTGGLGDLKTQAYADWVKDQIRSDRPWDKFVTDLLSAKGYLWESPAIGYLLTDQGMELCNLSNTFTTFTGTEITCAQCHDHPFEQVMQIDFYRMAAFFGNLSYDSTENDRLLGHIQSRKKDFAEGAKAAKQNAADLNRLFAGYNVNLGDTAPENVVKLPFDYQYDNGEPHQSMLPGVYFGDPIDVSAADSPRRAFAEWMTAETNPRFTINIVNRLWKHVFGIAQIEPVDNIPGHLDGQAQNYDLLKYLERLMVEVNYSVKDFLRVLYNTKTYQREACYTSPTLSMIDRGEFHFPAPILRRLSAEQLWDSMVAMSVDDPEASERRTRILEAYREIMSVDWRLTTYTDARDRLQKHNQLGRQTNNNQMKRASELPLPNRVGTFLYAFGQSDKKYIENSSRDGTIPQVMELLNGSLTNKVMSADSKEMVHLAKSETSVNDGIDIIFLSILSRLPKPMERDYAKTLVPGDGKGSDYSDLIWALLNMREFMFIQ